MGRTRRHKVFTFLNYGIKISFFYKNALIHLFSRTCLGAGGLPYSGYIDKNNFNTSKTPGLYQCGGVTNNDVGINFWGIVLIVKSNDYISQLLIGNVFAWRNLGDDGLTWGKFNIVTARTQ